MKQQYIRPEIFKIVLGQNLMLSYSTSCDSEISPGQARAPRNGSSTDDTDENWE